MRLPSVLVLGTSMVVACGGSGKGASPPKSEDEAEHGSSKSDGDKKGATASATSSAASEPAPAAPSSTPGPSTSKPSSGDLTAPAADDPWMAPHQMPPGDVLKTMRAAMGRVNACYHTAKRHDPGVSGDVKIKFVISHEGQVRVWRDEDSSMTDQDCTKCVGEVIKGLKFPTQKSPGDAWGLYTINFGG
jgi:hypothetical protein